MGRTQRWVSVPACLGSCRPELVKPKCGEPCRDPAVAFTLGDSTLYAHPECAARLTQTCAQLAQQLHQESLAVMTTDSGRNLLDVTGLESRSRGDSVNHETQLTHDVLLRGYSTYGFAPVALLPPPST